uniref:CCHC-type domain-containing protein n=1 Tax=Cajanus cajan TaxID=3821 RepID=A0A151RFK0_CAJCA|nr:hypothetical protein KK1_037308 [Cajanus cajan]
MDAYYQPHPRRVIKEHKVRESRVDLPYFHGKEDVDAYLDWEMKVEQIFTCHQVGEERKVPLATLAFQGQAMYWWTSLERERRLHNDPPITYWNELRSAMRRRHIPSYYSRELMDKLQRLQQKNMSVEEYRQKMELYLMRAGIREEERLTIARFLSGLNFDIRDRVELLPYRDLDDLVQLCIRVEQQNLRKGKTQTNSYIKKDYKREGQDNSSTNSSKGQEKEKESDKNKNVVTSSSKTSDIKCFKCLGRGHIASQCPTKKVMILRGQDIYSSLDESSSTTSSDSETSKEDPQIEKLYPVDGDLLMVKRLLGSQPSLTTIPHPHPYKLHWLNEGEELEVNQQVKVKFSIGDYKDKVLCDVIPMEACHILLVFEDQKQMKIKRNKERKENKLLGKSVNEGDSTKAFVTKESYFITKQALKRTLFIHKSLDSYPNAATNLKVENEEQNKFQAKNFQLRDIVKKKWTISSFTPYTTSLEVHKGGSIYVVLIKHPIFGLHCLVDTTFNNLYYMFALMRRSYSFELNMIPSLQDKSSLYDYEYPISNQIQNCLGRFLVVFSLYSRKSLGYHLGYFRQDVVVFKNHSFHCLNHSVITFLGFHSRLYLEEDPISTFRESKFYSLFFFLRLDRRTPLRIHNPFSYHENFTSYTWHGVYVGDNSYSIHPQDLRTNPFQEGGDDGIMLRKERGDNLKDPRGVGKAWRFGPVKAQWARWAWKAQVKLLMGLF